MEQLVPKTGAQTHQYRTVYWNSVGIKNAPMIRISVMNMDKDWCHVGKLGESLPLLTLGYYIFNHVQS